MGYSLSSLRPVILGAFLAITLPGCVSLAGSQDRIIDPRRPDGGLPGLSVRDALREYYAPTTTTTVTETTPDGRTTRRTDTTAITTPATGREVRGDLSQRQWRDYVAGIYRDAINANFADFAGRMSSERREIGLGADIVSTSLTSYATVASRAITRQLSAAVAGFEGLRGDTERNLYFDRATLAIVASMDAERARILTRIEEGLTRDENAYSLRDAFRDLGQLEAAGSLDRAIADITRDATEQRQEAERELATAVESCQQDDTAFDLNATLVALVQRLERAAPAADLADRTRQLQQVGLVVGIDATTVVSLPPADLSTLIRRRLDAGIEGRCAASDYQTIIDRIIAQGITVP